MTKKTGGPGRPSDTINKAELSRRLGVTPAMISKYIKQYKMPVRPDGSLSWRAVQAWHKAFIIPELSGSFNARQRSHFHRVEPPPAIDRDAVIRANAIRELFEQLIAESDRLPEMLARAGVTDSRVLALAQEVFVDALFTLGDSLSDVAYDWQYDDDRSLAPKVDLPAILSAHGLPAVDSGAVDAFLEEWEGVVFSEMLPPGGPSVRG